MSQNAEKSNSRIYIHDPEAILKTVLADKKLSSTAKVVFVTLCTHANRETGECWPSENLLVEETGRYRSGVCKSLKELKERDLIIIKKVEEEKKDKRRNVYSISELRPKDRTDQQLNNVPKSGHCTSRNQDIVCPEDKTQPGSSHNKENNKENYRGNRGEKPAAKNEKIILSFPLKNGKTWNLVESKFIEFCETFTHVTPEIITAALKKSRQWLQDNPQNRKTPKGMPKFLSSWLGRERFPIEKKNPEPGKFDKSETSNSEFQKIRPALAAEFNGGEFSGKEIIDDWFEGAELINTNGRTRIKIPSGYRRDYIAENYTIKLEKFFKKPVDIVLSGPLTGDIS